jgi:3-deoxy-D-manno-octulosonic-acid transferase
MSFLYNLAFLLFGIAYLPIFLVKIRQAESRRTLLAERLGCFPRGWEEKFLGKKILWLHAVSVGEVMAVQKFVERFLELFPEYHVVVTTVTPTGQKIAKKMEGEKISVCYFPFDLTGIVRKFLRRLKPECILLVETEIWPNLLIEAKRAGVPVGVVNGRLSARSVRRYDKFRFFFKPLFRRLDFVFVQGPEDARRFARLGVDSVRIHVLGNMKFDNVSLASQEGASVLDQRQQWGFEPEDWVWMAGSTHAGEEEILVNVFLDLLETYPSLKLFLAPRHVERCPELADWLKKRGFRVRVATDPEPEQNFQVLLLDQLGVLKHNYGLADVVFMGGSLEPSGGQNPIEPAHFKRAIIHGPYVFNFENIYRALDREGGALLVRDEAQLKFALKRLFEHAQERHQLGENAFESVSRLQGATDRHIEWLSKFLHSHDQLERIPHVEFHEKLFSSPR